MSFLGIDIGSRTIKTVLVDNGKIVTWEVVDATSRPLDVAHAILDKHPSLPAMATGYGRHLLELNEIPAVTEIKACARGAHHLHPEARVVIDIGGQDCKVIVLDERGKIIKFEMNDRCAAGTGRFLEIMAQRLDLTLDKFVTAARRGTSGITISSLCTVFAESEVVGLLNRNIPPGDIARAIHESVLRKIGGMYRRIAENGLPVVIAGGGALNSVLVDLLQSSYGLDVQSVDNPQITCALGAALIGMESVETPGPV